jgi:hypothetical protein
MPFRCENVLKGSHLLLRSAINAGNRIGISSLNQQKRPARPLFRTLKDEQRQRIGGGYEAVRFRFLLFL